MEISRQDLIAEVMMRGGASRLVKDEVTSDSDSISESSGGTMITVSENSDIHPDDYIPITEAPAFPFDLIKMKIRNRKLLNSLNQKCRFKDFEYKNYDSTDSDVYEEEDYLNMNKREME